MRTPCTIHSCHNSLKWALKDYLDDKQKMKDTWSVVTSLRTSFGTLQTFVDVWITARLGFHGKRTRPIPRQVWECLRYGADLIGDLDKFQLSFENGILYVSGEYKDHSTLQLELRMLFMQVFRVHECSDSRWLGASRSSREMVGAVLLGVEDFVQFSLGRGHSSYSLSSFMKMDIDMKEFFVLASIGSYAVDSCMAILLNDDRWTGLLGKLDDTMQEQIELVSSLDEAVWVALARGTGVPFGRLRSGCMAVALTSSAYLSQKLSCARCLPWAALALLAPEALQAIVQMDEPTEDICWKLWSLTRLGMDRSILEEGIHLLQQLSWSTVSTEQGHTAGSKVLQQHRVCGGTLQDRSVLWQARCLFKKGDAEVLLDRSRQKLKRLRAKVPERICGKASFVGDLCHLAARSGRYQGYDEASLGKTIVARHGAAWRAMGPELKRQFELKAQAERRVKRARLDEEIVGVVADIREKWAATEVAKATQDTPSRFSSCRLSELELLQFDDMWDAAQFSRRRLERERKFNEEAIGPISDIEQEALASARQFPCMPHHRPPRWVWELAMLRRN